MAREVLSFAADERIKERLEREADAEGISLSERLRKAVGDAEPDFRELGVTGLKRWRGEVQDEFLDELQGKKGVETYREMWLNDPVVGAALFGIEQAIRSVNWEVRAAGPEDRDERLANFLRECIDDMSHTWNDFISEILTMLVYGWSYFEICYKRREGEEGEHASDFDDGLVGWRKFSIRAQTSLAKWEFDEEGGIQAFVQRDPKSYEPLPIPIEKSLLFRTKILKGSPEGRSLLRNAYRPYYFKKEIQEIEGIGIERDLAGLPVVYLPVGFTTEAEEGASSDEAKAKRLVTRARRDELEGITLPGPKADDLEDYEAGGWRFELLASQGGREFDTNQIIQRYERRIAMSLLSQWLMLGMAARTGSYALSRNQSNFFLMALEGFVESIASTINRFAIPRLMKLNGEEAPYPRIEPSRLARPDLEQVVNAVRLMADLGLDVADLEGQLRELSGLPEAPESRKESFVQQEEPWQVSDEGIERAEEAFGDIVNELFEKQADLEGLPGLEERDATQEELRERFEEQAKELSTAFREGEITREEWRERMEDLVKSLHIAAAASAIGGFELIGDDEREAIDEELREQHEYLDDFEREVQTMEEEDEPLTTQIDARAAMYAGAAAAVYHRLLPEQREMSQVRWIAKMDENTCDNCAQQHREGWMPIAQLPGHPGKDICVAPMNCRCHLEYR